MEKYYEQPQIQTSFLTKVYAYLGLGMALCTAGTYLGYMIAMASPNTYYVLMIISCIVNLIIAIALGRTLNNMNSILTKILYCLYSLLDGLTISSLLLYYTGASVLMAFATTSVVFFSLMAIAKTTKIDLTKFRNLFLVGLIVSLVMTLLNVFIFHATILDTILIYVNVFLFMGLVAYDTQMIEEYANMDFGDSYAVYAAFQLLIDFINLFIRIVQIFGRRKDD